jgi:hypothetical protein
MGDKKSKLTKLGVLLVIGFALPACKVITTEQPSQTNKTTYLHGTSFNVDVFVRTTKDTAILDWFYEEKIPRYSFTDTLYTGRSEDVLWESDSSKIYKRRNRVVLETKSPYVPPQPLICRLKTSGQEAWEKQWHICKNVYLLREEYLVFTSDTNYTTDNRILLWNRMFAESGLQNQMSELCHNEFITVFMKFKTELMKEARKVDSP